MNVPWASGSSLCCCCCCEGYLNSSFTETLTIVLSGFEDADCTTNSPSSSSFGSFTGLNGSWIVPVIYTGSGQISCSVFGTLVIGEWSLKTYDTSDCSGPFTEQTGDIILQVNCGALGVSGSIQFTIFMDDPVNPPASILDCPNTGAFSFDYFSLVSKNGEGSIG